MLYDVIQELAKHEGLTLVSAITSPLPKVKRCSFHMIDENTPRCYLLARFKLNNGQIKYVLDIDTSDRKRSLSSKVFQLRREFNGDENIDELLASTVKKSLRWPKEKFDKYCLNRKDISHPRSQNKLFHEEQLKAWGIRLTNALVSGC